MSINVQFIEADQNWQDGTTTYWFKLDGEDRGRAFEGETFGIVEGERNPGPVDSDGTPVDYNDHLRAIIVDVCRVDDDLRMKVSGL
ncbi:MAG TPA: hypothetical protein PKZ27_14975 [Rhodocyclaceae bacterium]|nr:hypothetical protein [Rhodocyclaceae bacterium]